MRYVFDNEAAIMRKLRARGCALLLDFDLTLSPLAKNPKHARLPTRTKLLLSEIKAHIPVAIVTGRSIADVKKRVGVSGLWYAGNHGLERESRGVKAYARIPKASMRRLEAYRKKFADLKKKYPAIVVEDKTLGLALNYRLLAAESVPGFLRDLKKLAQEAALDERTDMRHTKKTFELRPRVPEHKGTACRAILKSMKKGIVPVYIGDSETDEDAFAALPEGITIKVGRSRKSRAKFYLRNQREVYLFLSRLYGALRGS